MYTIMVSQYWGHKEALKTFTQLIDAVNYIQAIKPTYADINDVVFTIESEGV